VMFGRRAADREPACRFPRTASALRRRGGAAHFRRARGASGEPQPNVVVACRLGQCGVGTVAGRDGQTSEVWRIGAAHVRRIRFRKSGHFLHRRRLPKSGGLVLRVPVGQSRLERSTEALSDQTSEVWPFHEFHENIYRS